MSLVLDQVALTIGGRPLVKQVSLNLNPGEVVDCLGPMEPVKPQRSTWSLVCCALIPVRW